MRINFAAVSFVSGDADMMQPVLFAFEPINLFIHKMGFELSGTPTYFHPRPTVAGQRLAHSDTALYGPLLLLGNVIHQPFKAMGVPQSGDMDAALPVEKIIQPCDMGLHLRKFHGRIGVENTINGHTLFNHQQEHGRRILPAGE